MRLNHKPILFLIILILMLGIAAWRAGLNLLPVTPPKIYGMTFSEPKTLAPFVLQSAGGRAFTQKDLHGHWSFIYFGYTHCPDACPITMLQFKQLQGTLRKTMPKQRLAFIMVTVDPERDTPKLMQAYVNHFATSFHGLSGDSMEIKAFAKQLFVGYQRGEDNTAIGYTMYHSDSIAVINPDGQFAAVFASPHKAKNMAQDFLKVAAYQQQRDQSLFYR